VGQVAAEDGQVGLGRFERRGQRGEGGGVRTPEVRVRYVGEGTQVARLSG
jgi:hypothetical protein